MTTLLIQDRVFRAHRVPQGHPERPERLAAIDTALSAARFDTLQRATAPRGEEIALQSAHTEAHIARIREASHDGIAALDSDTVTSPAGFEAALHAVGAACKAVDAVITGDVANAFVACRPPGHHAEQDRSMGFCLFNTVAIAARYAQGQHGARRVAIIDWDVHHGNGTQDIVQEDGSILYASTHQMPFYPGTGAREETGVGNIVNIPLSPGDGSAPFRRALGVHILPAIADFAPDLILISAGFDAHQDDPLGGLALETEDFAWATHAVMEVAGQCCQGRIVSLLEGGYDLQALADSSGAHLTALMTAR
ncbi:MAG: histone deacetylase family protein [Alphaproteobacteria bacterium]